MILNLQGTMRWKVSKHTSYVRVLSMQSADQSVEKPRYHNVPVTEVTGRRGVEGTMFQDANLTRHV